MARTRQKARGAVTVWRRCVLLQLMGFPLEGHSDSTATVDAAQLQANWPAVMERLSSHPDEAQFQYEFREYPLRLALANQTTPLTRDALEAFVEAYPRALSSLKEEDPAPSDPTIIAALGKAKQTYLCGAHRTRTFQLMGFHIDCEKPTPLFHFIDHRSGTHARSNSYHVDWPALEEHLKKHPQEAKIMCPDLFPLEVALKFAHPPMPLTTLQLLMTLYPQALTIPDSPSLYFACSLRERDDPQFIRTILHANPSLAASELQNQFKIWQNMGLPIHEALRLPCAVEILPELIEANPASLSAQTDMWKQIPLQVAAEIYSLPIQVWRILLENGHRHGACANYPGGQLFFVNGEREFGADNIQSAMDIIMDKPGISIDDEVWQFPRLALLAAAAFRTGLSVETMWECPLLHAAIEFGRRKKMIFERVYKHTNSQERNIVDALGRTPLAVAIETAKSKQNNDHPWDDEEEEDFLKLDTVIKRLLDDWPQSASIPITKKSNSNDAPITTTLPLHKALNQGISLEDGSEHILNAFPEALAIADPVTKLIPCLLAATIGSDIEEAARSSVNTIYGLMMKRPDLMITLMK